MLKNYSGFMEKGTNVNFSEKLSGNKLHKILQLANLGNLYSTGEAFFRDISPKNAVKSNQPKIFLEIHRKITCRYL